MKNESYTTILRNIRIIGGKWKGRKIPVACNVKGMRPTTNCMRETLFNWIDPIILDAVCLDCFAGSGALGLESLSRGAHKVTFIERSNICIKILMKTMNDLFLYNNENIEIIHSDCFHWLQQSNEVYDIIFIDPPFQNNMIPKIVRFLEKYNHFKKESWIYMETSNIQNIFNISTLPYYWDLYRKKITNTTACYLYLRAL